MHFTPKESEEGKEITDPASTESTGDTQRVNMPNTLRSSEEVVMQKLVDIEVRLQSLRDLFENKIARDKTKGEMIRALLEQNQWYRDEFMFRQLVEPLIRGFIRVFDRLSDLLEVLQNDSTANKHYIAAINSLRKEMLYVFKKHSIVPIVPTEPRFDESYQEAIGVIPVASPHDDQRIIKIVREGFTFRGKLLRPAKVIVGKYNNETKGGETNDKCGRD